MESGPKDYGIWTFSWANKMLGPFISDEKQSISLIDVNCVVWTLKKKNIMITRFRVAGH